MLTVAGSSPSLGAQLGKQLQRRVIGVRHQPLAFELHRPVNGARACGFTRHGKGVGRCVVTGKHGQWRVGLASGHVLDQRVAVAIAHVKSSPRHLGNGVGGGVAFGEVNRQAFIAQIAARVRQKKPGLWAGVKGVELHAVGCAAGGVSWHYSAVKTQGMSRTWSKKHRKQTLTFWVQQIEKTTL